MTHKKEILDATTWRTQRGEVLNVSEMRTSHLYNCVRMLWNHHAPDHVQIRPFNRYRIRMRREYIVSRMRAMIIELSKRDDLTEVQHKTLTWMSDQFSLEKIDND